MGRDTMYCDNCGDPFVAADESDQYPVSVLPVDVDSANAGESALLCADCHGDMLKRAAAGALSSTESWSLARHTAESDYGADAYTLWPSGSIIPHLSGGDARLMAEARNLLDAARDLREHLWDVDSPMVDTLREVLDRIAGDAPT